MWILWMDIWMDIWMDTWMDTRIWVNYNISLTWIKAILGWFPLLTMIIVRSQWGRCNLPRRMDIWMDIIIESMNNWNYPQKKWQVKVTSACAVLQRILNQKYWHVSWIWPWKRGMLYSMKVRRDLLLNFQSIICIMTYVYIIIYVCVFSSRRQNELFASGTKIQVIRFGGGPVALQCFVQINTKYSNTKMQRNWLIQISKLLGMD